MMGPEVVCLAYGVMVFVVMVLLGVDVPGLFGLLAFLLNFIPEVRSGARRPAASESTEGLAM